MNEWKDYELGNLADIKGGKRLPKGKMLVEYKTEHPYIRVTDITNYKIDVNTLLFVEPEVQKTIKRYTVNTGDLILSIVGTIGLVAIVPSNLDKANLTENCVKLKIKNYNLDSKFLYHYLRSKTGQEEIDSLVVGSTQPKFPLYNIKKIKLFLPPLLEQECIAEVLCSLDEKIDLLHRNNKTLEQLAETLFRQWFVEEVKEEWNEVKLGSHISLVSGYSYRSVDLNNSTKALVTLKNFDRNGGFRHDGFKEYTGKYKGDQVVVSGDLIVAHTDITQEAEVLGNPAIVISSSKYETLIISTDLVKVVPTSYLSKAYIYFLMKTDDFKHYCLGNSNGTTVLHLSKKALPGYDIKLPPSLLVEKFTEIAEPLLEKMNTNQKHIQQLETLRETLLPKLMSGLVRVEN